MTGILVFFHCGANTGYAIGRHEVTFAHMAHRLVGSFDKVHFAYPSYDRGISQGLPAELNNFVLFNPRSRDVNHLEKIKAYLKRWKIRVIFGFDQPVSQPSYPYLRKGGVEWFFSYWGAPMSSIYPSILLPLRKLQYRLNRGGPDHYIFQSEGMRRTATHGVGIPIERTSVVRSGVDTELFKSPDQPSYYVHDLLGISHDKKIIYYSGHMEERKGVHVIVKAAAHLINSLKRRDLHFVFLGNRNGEEERFFSLYKNTEAENHITFAGYRDDIAQIQASSYLAVIATTGWDSHTMTAVEVAASGLPLLVSDLPGIREAVSDSTGLRFKPGDHLELAQKISLLADDQSLRDRLGAAARQRVLAGHTREHQIKGLEKVIRSLAGDLFLR